MILKLGPKLGVSYMMGSKISKVGKSLMLFENFGDFPSFLSHHLINKGIIRKILLTKTERPKRSRKCKV